MALIERLPDVQGVIVSSGNEVLISSGLKDRLVLFAPPTDAPNPRERCHDHFAPLPLEEDEPVWTLLRIHVQPLAVITANTFARHNLGTANRSRISSSPRTCGVYPVRRTVLDV